MCCFSRRKHISTQCFHLVLFTCVFFKAAPRGHICPEISVVLGFGFGVLFVSFLFVCLFVVYSLDFFYSHPRAPTYKVVVIRTEWPQVLAHGLASFSFPDPTYLQRRKKNISSRKDELNHEVKTRAGGPLSEIHMFSKI